MQVRSLAVSLDGRMPPGWAVPRRQEGGGAGGGRRAGGLNEMHITARARVTDREMGPALQGQGDRREEGYREDPGSLDPFLLLKQRSCEVDGGGSFPGGRMRVSARGLDWLG